MMNIFEYLEKRDLEEIGEYPKEVDIFVLTCLSYTKFEFLFSSKKRRMRMTIGDYCYYYMKASEENDFGKHSHLRLIMAIKDNPRYKDIPIIHLASSFDSAQEKQYASIAFRVGKKNIVLAFRGTDSTLVGWKEDINLALYDAIPSEIAAQKTLDSLIMQHPLSRFYVAGHSKGGLLALYAASHVFAKNQRHVSSVFEFDAPGLKDDQVYDDGYLNIVNRIHGYVPEECIVGLIFNKKHAISVIKSSAKGLMQHDAFSWEIDGTRLLHLEEFYSRDAMKPGIINELRQHYSDEEMQQYIDSLYKIVKEDDDTATISNMLNKEKAKTVYHEYKKLDKSEKKIVKRITFKVIWNALWKKKKKSAK